MIGLVVLFVVGLVCLIGGIVLVRNHADDPIGYGCGILGIMFLVIVTFFLIPISLHTGSPAVSIDAGEYQVAFVYVAGGNVSVGIEKENSRFGEGLHLFLYQFPGNAFEGGIKYNARKLVVTESGEFKKLRFE